MSDIYDSCLVTPSYAGDFDRCRLLVESRRVCAPHINHYLIIDPPDLALFRELADARTIIVPSRELLDGELHKLWGSNGWWFGRRVPPLRGWITQQLYKLSMPRLVDHDVLINIDSDCVFVRPFSAAHLFSNGDVGLPEVDYRNAEIEGWTRTAASLLAIEAPNVPNNYVGNMISWRADVVRQLTDRIADIADVPWQVALGRCKSFSEYMLYGTFVRCVLGWEESGHFPDTRPIVTTSWGKPTGSAGDLAALFTDLPDEAVAVMVHSKDGVQTSDYREFAQRMWARS